MDSYLWSLINIPTKQENVDKFQFKILSVASERHTIHSIQQIEKRERAKCLCSSARPQSTWLRRETYKMSSLACSVAHDRLMMAAGI